MPDNMLISIVIPCRNEEKFISKCLESVYSFEKPSGCEIEILVIDGMSEDRTKEIVLEIIKQRTNIRLLDNAGKIQSSALNIGVNAAKGKYILRLDAHSDYPGNYLQLLYETAIRIDADNTGGLVITQAYDKSYNASIVQALTTHKFGVGNSGFRVGMKEGAADTVPYGFFKKEIFKKAGFFDERLVRAQDYEFNRRIIRSGGKIWLNPEIQLNYYNQPDFGRFLKKQILKEAPYNAYMWYLASYTFTLRHAVTAVFTAGIFAGIILAFFFSVIKYIFAFVMATYFIFSVFSSVQQAIRYKKPVHIFVLPFCFFFFHFLHGAGVLWGILMLLLRTAPVLKYKEPWKDAGHFKAIDYIKN